jgi:hypothetical protein
VAPVPVNVAGGVYGTGSAQGPLGDRTPRGRNQGVAPLGQDEWAQHIAYIAGRVDVEPTTVHTMIVEASVAGGASRGGLSGDRGQDLDCGRFLPRTVVEIATTHRWFQRVPVERTVVIDGTVSGPSPPHS